MRNNILNIIAVLSLFAFCSGCANWTPNWQIHDKNTQKEETVHLLESAREIRLNADTKEVIGILVGGHSDEFQGINMACKIDVLINTIQTEGINIYE